MYLVDHIFQNDIAKFYKISPALVSRLVKEAQREPHKLLALQVKEEDGKQIKEAVKRVVTDMLLNGVAIVKAETVVEEAKKKADIEVTVE